MILDTLENIGKYAALNPLFPKVVEYLQNTDLMAQAPGRVNIDGNKLFVNHNVAKGKTVDFCLKILCYERSQSYKPIYYITHLHEISRVQSRQIMGKNSGHHRLGRECGVTAQG